MLYNRGSTYIRNTPGKIPADVAVTDTRSLFSSSTYDDSNSGIDGLQTGGYAIRLLFISTVRTTYSNVTLSYIHVL